MKTFMFSIFFLILSTFSLAQQLDTVITQANIKSGDTLLIKQLNEVEVFPKFKHAYQQRRYDRLVRYVKKVYPYAQIAADKMHEYEDVLLSTPDKGEQRKIMKQVEDEIYAEWEGDLKELTYMQGGILLKLIDRQTGESSYELVKEFRGSFRAFFYQSFARLFGFNLKERYNPKENYYDQQIEYIVHLIETNRL